MGCEQSTAPEDTREAREEGLDADDFEQEAPERKCLTADAILNADDRGYANNWVPTPEWGGPGHGVYLLTPSGEDRERYERMRKTKQVKKHGRVVNETEMDLDSIRERLMIDFACNEDGERLFPCFNKEQTRETVRKLKKKAAAPIGRIGDRALQIMGWSESDIEELVGNSESGQS